MAEAKEATYEDIDKAMMLGMRHPMGPLRLADFVGLVRPRGSHRISVCSTSPRASHSVMESIYEATGEPQYAPPGLLRRLVQAGWLGVKSGKVRAPPPLTRRASTTTARRHSVFSQPQPSQRAAPVDKAAPAVLPPGSIARRARREPCLLPAPWTTSARVVSPSTGATCSTSTMPSGAAWSASTGTSRAHSHSNGNKYWENLEEQPGRTRWVDYASHDADTTQLEPIWHAWLVHTRKDPPSEDRSLQHFMHSWEGVRTRPTHRAAHERELYRHARLLPHIQHDQAQAVRVGAQDRPARRPIVG